MSGSESPLLDGPGAAQAQASEVGPVPLNSRVELRCRLDDPGYPQAHFEWTKTSGNVRGAVGDNGELIVANVARDDAGTYQCLPRNTVGVGVADTVVLLVEDSGGNTYQGHVDTRMVKRFKQVQLPSLCYVFLIVLG